MGPCASLSNKRTKLILLKKWLLKPLLTWNFDILFNQTFTSLSNNNFDLGNDVNFYCLTSTSWQTTTSTGVYLWVLHNDCHLTRLRLKNRNLTDWKNTVKKGWQERNYWNLKIRNKVTIKSLRNSALMSLLKKQYQWKLSRTL